MDSRSILATILNPKITLPDQPAYWHYPHFSNQLGRPAGAVRLGDYKLTESYETGEMELYNLREDMGESKNLASTMPKKKQEMAALFKAWQKQVKANMPVRK
jgi:hypothetical protein